MTDERLKSLMGQHIRQSLGYLGGQISDDRRQAWDYYYGEGFGSEVEGRSQVVLHDVADTIEWVMPSLMRIFTQNDSMVRFDPRQQNDEPFAEQATELVNYIFTQQLNGFMLLYDVFKDALLQKTGVIKSWWDDSVETETLTYGGIDQLEIEQIMADGNVEVDKIEPVGETPEGVPLADVTFTRTLSKGRITSIVVAPDEFLISKRAVNLEEAPFVAHRTKKTVSELLEMGYPEDKLMRLTTEAGYEWNQERTARWDVDEDSWSRDTTTDPSMKEVWIHECYPLVDWDGDGKAELRRIIVGGDQPYEVLENEPCDERPFDAICPIPMPHKFYGRSLADTVMDLQQIRSTLLRQVIDNAYLQNNSRWAMWDGEVELDDMLYQRAGGVVRTNRNPQEALMPLVTPSLNNQIFPIIEYMEDVRAGRTGITRYNQGLDAGRLNDTATGIAKIQAAANQRIELIARIFAETGVKPLFGRYLRLMVKHQDEPMTIRLRDEFVEMDPRVWNTNMDVTTEVGLGYDNRDQEAAMAAAVLDRQMAAIPLQGGAQGPIVTMEGIHEAAMKFTQAAGLKHPEKFWGDPKSPEMQQVMQEMAQRPDPEAMKAQAEQQAAQAKLQLEQAKMQAEEQEAGAKLELERWRAEEELRLERYKIDMEAELKREEMGLKARETGVKAEVEIDKAVIAANAQSNGQDSASAD